MTDKGLQVPWFAKALFFLQKNTKDINYYVEDGNPDLYILRIYPFVRVSFGRRMFGRQSIPVATELATQAPLFYDSIRNIVTHIMKIILLQDTAKLGKRGEVKDVADAYAINVLIKKGLALQATQSELAKWKAKEEAKQHKKDILTNTFLQLVDKLHHERVRITGKKRDEKGQLFAQIKEVDIVDAIFAVTGLSIDTKQVSISSPIKSIGTYTIELKQGTQKEMVTVEII